MTQSPTPSFLALALTACLLRSSSGFNSPTLPRSIQQHGPRHEVRSETRLNLEMEGQQHHQSPLNPDNSIIHSATRRRDFFASIAASAAITTGLIAGIPTQANAAPSAKSTSDAAITDKIFIEFKGMSAPGEPNDRITIGLFGNDAPQPVSILKQLVTKDGYKSRCKPLDDSRLLQKEQLEANKVYNSCLDTEDTVGVNYDYSTVWRVVKDERIDVGAISGRFIAREPPNFVDIQSGLAHDAAGVVSVRRGDDGGYGFTIFPGTNNNKGAAAATLDEDNVVIGRIIEGMDVVDKLNSIPVVKSAGMTMMGGPKAKTAPSRGCRYGGSEYYCSEDKPLKKVLLDKTGVL